MSAQRLSSLFSLRKFCSVANLKFDCSVWHGRSEGLFDKNSHYESLWDWVFNVFLSRYRKKIFAKVIVFQPIFNKVVLTERSRILLCACILP